MTTLTLESASLKHTKNIVKYFEEHSKYPADDDSNPDVSKLGKWLTARRLKGEAKLYPSIVEYANSNGHPGLFVSVKKATTFESNDPDQIYQIYEIDVPIRPVRVDQIETDSQLHQRSIKVVQDVIKFKTIHGRYPGRTQISELSMGKWLINVREIQLSSEHPTWFAEIQKIADDADCSDMFNEI